MPNLTPEKPVVAVALDRPGGDAAVRRVMSAGMPVVVLAERGLPQPARALDTVLVPTNHARVGPAVREAVSRNTAWVAVPRTMGTAEYLVSAALRSVGRHVDDDHPGIAMLVVSAEQDPEEPYRRVLGVVDPEGPRTSGMTALAAVEFAVHTKAALDVLVLGVPENGSPSSMEEWLALVPVERRSELLRRAIQMAGEQGVPITWLPRSVADPVAAVSTAVHEGGYDLVIDGLGGHRLRKRVLRRHDIRRLVHDPANGGLVRHLIEETACDVLVVIDAISLGLVSATTVRVGAATALAVGAVGLSTPVAAQPQASGSASPGGGLQMSAAPHVPGGGLSSPPTLYEVVAEESADPEAAGAEPDDEPVEPEPEPEPSESGTPPAEPDETTTEQAASPADEAPEEERVVRASEVTEAQRQAEAALSEAREADSAAAEAEERVKAANDDVTAAEARVEQVQENAQPAAQELSDAILELRRVELERIEAERERAAAQRRVNVVTSLVTRGGVEDSARKAAEVVAAAEDGARQAMSEHAVAYEEYLRFAAEVQAAEAAYLGAADDLEAATAELQALADEARTAQQVSEKLEADARAMEEAYVEQGLHAPATGAITSAFGPRVHPLTGAQHQHNGTDFEGTDGNYYAAADGVITHTGYDGSYGYILKIDHGVVQGKHVETWYAHQPGLEMQVGEQVDRGQVIGRIGSSGSSTGPHAHVELRVDGDPLDITQYLS